MKYRLTPINIVMWIAMLIGCVLVALYGDPRTTPWLLIFMFPLLFLLIDFLIQLVFRKYQRVLLAEFSLIVLLVIAISFYNLLKP